METWRIIALTVLISGATGLISAFFWHIGVIGVLSTMRRRLAEHDNDLASLEERVNKLFKQRASDASQEARTGAKTLTEEARDRLEHETPPAASQGRTVPLGFLRK